MVGNSSQAPKHHRYMKNDTRLLTQTMQKRVDKMMPCHAAADDRRLTLMAKRLAQRIRRRKRRTRSPRLRRSFQSIMRTAEIIAQQKKLFREQFGREPGPGDPLFFDPGVAA